MSTEDNKPDSRQLFGITLNMLRELMKQRGSDGVHHIQEHGGIPELCKKLNTSPNDGISATAADIDNRRALFGSNTIRSKPPKSFLRLVWEAMQDVTLIILEVAALVSLCLSFYIPHDGDSGV